MPMRSRKVSESIEYYWRTTDAWNERGWRFVRFWKDVFASG